MLVFPDSDGPHNRTVSSNGRLALASEGRMSLSLSSSWIAKFLVPSPKEDPDEKKILASRYNNHAKRRLPTILMDASGPTICSNRGSISWMALITGGGKNGVRFSRSFV